MEPAVESKKPGRRWFRYSLRTVFILVTLLCCWLAWETGVVHERKALRAEFKSRAIYFGEADGTVSPAPPGVAPRAVAKVSVVRRVLGDKAIQEISYTYITNDERERLTKTFPEARLRELEMLHEPCHPGCFPRGTRVETPSGGRVIESIVAGDIVSTVLPNGELAKAPVQSVFITDNRIWRVETDCGELLTTETQPLCLSAESFVQAGQLSPGDEILVWSEGGSLSAKVQRISRTDRTGKVFNLILGNSEVFVAGGFLARSKPPAQVASR